MDVIQRLRKYASALYRGSVSLVLETYMRLKYGQALLSKNRSQVLRRWEGETGLAGVTRIAVLVHYDQHGMVHDYVRHYLEELRNAGYTPLFVSNSPQLAANDIDYLTTRCGLVLLRRNQGYDFGAYKDALQTIPDLSRLDSLIIANDSVYGPFHSLAKLLERADPRRADIWGITDSYERRYHLQTYFLLVHRRALIEPAFQAFWRDVRYVQSKLFVVDRYEIGLSRHALAAGLRLEALYPYADLALQTIERLRRLPLADREWRSKVAHGDYLHRLYETLASGATLNPSHFFWDQLLIERRCPFLKRELLTRNPCRIPLVLYWQEAIRSVSDYDTRLISQHLQHLLHQRTP